MPHRGERVAGMFVKIMRGPTGYRGIAQFGLSYPAVSASLGRGSDEISGIAQFGLSYPSVSASLGRGGDEVSGVAQVSPAIGPEAGCREVQSGAGEEFADGGKVPAELSTVVNGAGGLQVR